MQASDEKFVYVDTDDVLHEYDPVTGEGPILETCRDRVLCEASESSEEQTCGVIRAKLGIDKHWHFAGWLTREDRRKLRL